MDLDNGRYFTFNFMRKVRFMPYEIPEGIQSISLSKRVREATVYQKAKLDENKNPTHALKLARSTKPWARHLHNLGVQSVDTLHVKTAAIPKDQNLSYELSRR